MPFVLQVGISASQDRLENLIALRLQPGANKAEIDDRIWDLFGETWAIMFTDLAGFSRRSAEYGIIHFLQTIYESQRLLVPVIDDYDGILLKMDGDSMLILFKRPGKAIECAVEMQRILKNYNATKPDEEQILLCVGIGYGLMLRIGDTDVFGPQVNAASKLGEDTAKALEILVTDSVMEAAKDLAGVKFEPIDAIPPGAKAAYKLVYAV
jgi:class 3 adenylate cyclase